MHKRSFLTLGLLLLFGAPFAWADNSVADLKTYLAQRDQLKSLDLAALQTVAADATEKNVRRGLAGYYIFLKTPVPDGEVAVGTKAATELEKAAATYLDPLCYVKLAALYSRDNPGFGVRRDRAKALKYLSIAWEMADLSDRATGDNALLTLIVNNTLGLGDGLAGDGGGGDLAGILASIRPAVLEMRGRFKKLYQLSVKDEAPGSTNLERHYGR